VTINAVDELLARAPARVEVCLGDGKSGPLFQRLEIGGERYGAG
jgi:hypothetical protein